VSGRSEKEYALLFFAAPGNWGFHDDTGQQPFSFGMGMADFTPADIVHICEIPSGSFTYFSDGPEYFIVVPIIRTGFEEVEAEIHAG
jgi:hypothetical protein